MSFALENINISHTFGEAVEVPLIESTSIKLDTLEFMWGLNRGQILSYTSLPANFLRLQPELKKAIETERVALLPSADFVDQLFALQVRNSKHSLEKRKLFTDIFPFQEYEYQVVPVKGVSLCTRDPTTKKTSTFKGKGFPTFKCSAHPAFVLTYACDGLIEPPKTVSQQLESYGDRIENVFMMWSTTRVKLEFFKGSWQGEFGRSVPPKWRARVPKRAPAKVKEVVAVEENEGKKEEEEKAEEEAPAVKKRRLDGEEKQGAEVVKDFAESSKKDSAGASKKDSTRASKKASAGTAKKASAGASKKESAGASKKESVVDSKTDSAVAEPAKREASAKGQSSKRKRL